MLPCNRTDAPQPLAHEQGHGYEVGYIFLATPKGHPVYTLTKNSSIDSASYQDGACGEKSGVLREDVPT